jgi:hypothetical protein
MIIFPTMTTMLLAGVWHGAGLQFFIFGLLHGTYLSINHAWRLFFPVSSKPPPRLPPQPLRLWSAVWPVATTYLAVIVAQIFFRADSTGYALTLLRGMLGLNGIDLPLPAANPPPWLVSLHLLAPASVAAYEAVTLPLARTALLTLLLGVIAFGAPNIYQIMDKYSPALTKVRSSLHRVLLWRPDWNWALASGAMLFWASLRFDHPARFLYFQF